MSIESFKRCILCGKHTSNTVYSDLGDRFFATPGVFAIAQCTDCDFYFLRERPTPKAANTYYPPDFLAFQPPLHAGHQRTPKGVRDRIRTDLLLDRGYVVPQEHSPLPRPIIEIVKLLFPVRKTMGLGDLLPRFVPEGKLLDIGCGNGSYLALMRSLGWKVQGVDISPLAAKVAEETSGISVFAGTVEEAGFSDREFDFIVMRHVLEHVYEPAAMLGEVRRILKPEGSLVVEVPNNKSLMHTLFRRHWWLLEVPRHLWHFSRRSLNKLMAISGFSICSEEVLPDFWGVLNSMHCMAVEKASRPPDDRPVGETPKQRILLAMGKVVEALAFAIGERSHLRVTAKKRTSHIGTETSS